jgi:hypothetical protein
MAYEPVTYWEWLTHRSPSKGAIAVRNVVMFAENVDGGPLVKDLGIYNRRNIAGTSTKSLHSVGRAWDIGWETGFDAATLAGRLAIAAAFCGISEVIYFHRRWTAESGWQPYHGEDGHTTHIHVGFTKAWAYSTQPLSELQDWAAAVLYP